MKKVTVNEDACIACGACMRTAPEVFKFNDMGLSETKKEFIEDDDKNTIIAAEGCPTGAILIEDVKEECNCSCEDGECKCENCDCEHK